MNGSHFAFLAVCLLVVVLLPITVALAQSGSRYDLMWNTTDGGGATFATDGDYELGGTIGQPDAATWQGGRYVLAGGFWYGARIPTPPGYRILLPIIMRNH